MFGLQLTITVIEQCLAKEKVTSHLTLTGGVISFSFLKHYV